MKKAFTLAEVLITLGIIGVVAALTIPSLIIKHEKLVTITKLKKFYSNMNKAIKFSVIENGPSEYWSYPTENSNYHQLREFYNNYLAKYVVSTDVKSCRVPNYDPAFEFVCIYYSDGTAAIMRHIVSDSGGTGIDVIFYTSAKYLAQDVPMDSKRTFWFNFDKNGTNISTIQQYQIEPYTYMWAETRADLISNTKYGCRKNNVKPYFCTKLLQWDDWQIKDDYPW